MKDLASVYKYLSERERVESQRELLLFIVDRLHTDKDSSNVNCEDAIPRVRDVFDQES